MAAHLPQSNADIVALNLVYDAFIDEINTPGQSLAQLLEQMASLSRDIGGDFHAGGADWEQMLEQPQDAIESEFEPTVGRQALTIGDIWAKRWMLCMMAKHIHAKLEEECLDHPAASKIEVIAYGEDGSVDSWSTRKP